MTTVAEQVKVLEAIEGALRLSASFLTADPGRLPGQLTGRLAGCPEPDVSGLLEHIHEDAPRPWLRPLTPALAAPGGPLERIITDAGQVSALAVTPDGTLLLLGSSSGVIHIWNPASGQLERTLAGHTGVVSAVVVTPDGSRVVSGGGDTVRVWDLASGRLERTLESGADAVTDVAVTVAGTQIISGGSDGAVCVWDLATGRLEGRLVGHTG
jgi:WD40 repeat protein